MRRAHKLVNVIVCVPLTGYRQQAQSGLGLTLVFDRFVLVPCYLWTVRCSLETNIKMWQSECKSKALSHIMHAALDVIKNRLASI